MMIQRMEHVGIVVDDLAGATEFFLKLGLDLQGEGPVEGHWVDRVIGLEGVRAQIAMLQTPDGHGRLELTKFHTPSTQGGNRNAPANTPGIRHIAFAVEDIDAVVAVLRARGAELIGEPERYETAIGSATSGAPRGSSSSWQSASLRARSVPLNGMGFSRALTTLHKTGTRVCVKTHSLKGTAFRPSIKQSRWTGFR
jgi:catechol 2,3-dioxygenase-like lactoylglutathione lyase family enzyme